jgi:hypothetical protein
MPIRTYMHTYIHTYYDYLGIFMNPVRTSQDTDSNNEQPVDILCGQKECIVNRKAGGMYSNHCGYKRLNQ